MIEVEEASNISVNVTVSFDVIERSGDASETFTVIVKEASASD